MGDERKKIIDLLHNQFNENLAKALEQKIHEFIENILNPLKNFNGKTPDDLAKLKNLLQISLEKLNTEIQVLMSQGIKIEIKKPDLRLREEDCEC